MEKAPCSALFEGDCMTIQLSLFNDTPDDDKPQDKRPLPLIVADKFGFRLACIEHQPMLFNVQDWLLGLGVSKSSVRKEWSWLKKQLSNPENSLKVERTDYKATNGKTYQMDFSNERGLYLIAQNLRPLETRENMKGVLSSIYNYLADAGVFANLVRTEPEKVTVRLKSTIARNQLTDTLKAHATDQINFGQITNIEYVGLFLMKAAQICELTGARNARDGLTDLGLQFVTLCESYCSEHIRIRGHISFVEMCEVMNEVAHTLRISIDKMEQRLGISLVTGKPLLPSPR